MTLTTPEARTLLRLAGRAAKFEEAADTLTRLRDQLGEGELPALGPCIEELRAEREEAQARVHRMLEGKVGPDA